MDIQLSGAVDLSPLFNNMNKPAQAPTVSTPPKNYQGEMLAGQSSILNSLNQPYEAPQITGLPAGSTINLIA